MSPIQLPLGYQEIINLIPHRYPFLFLDKVLEFEEKKIIRGIKNVSGNEEFFQGHFPGRPIMPGVIIIEAMAQLGVIFAKLDSEQSGKDTLIVFGGVEEVKFRRPVVPGDVLDMKLELIKSKLGLWKMKGIATVDNEVAAEGILIAAQMR